jgi:hypothetical protein
MSPTYLRELALENFRTARSEIVARIQYRDTALLAYTVAVGGYAAFLFNTYKDSNHIPFEFESILFGATPLVSLFFTLIVLHHDYIAHANAAYIRSQFPSQNPMGLNEWMPRFHRWDINQRKKMGQLEDLGFSDLRFFGQLIPLTLPASFTVAYAWKNHSLFRPFDPDSATIVFFLVCGLDLLISVVIVALHLWVRAKKNELSTRDLREVVTTPYLA